MEAVLAKDEVVLKSWDYAKQGNRFDKNKLQQNLTITNKRIISSSENAYSLSRHEIPLSAVKSLKGTYRKNDSLWMKIKFWCAVFFSIIIVGIFFGSIKKAISLNQQIKSCVFELQIQTSGVEGTPFAIGAAPDTGLEQRKHFFSKSINKVKIYTDKEVARDILNVVGSLALENA